MGLEWSQFRPVRLGKSLVTSSAFPTNATLRSKIWDLWKVHKVDLKNDGFRVSKWKNVWKISYFQNIMPDSYNRVAPSNELQYVITFKAMYAKWNSISEMLPILSLTEEDVNEEDEDDSLWFIESCDQ
jgi:hypothetical protein